MPTCPLCGAEIDHLILESSYYTRKIHPVSIDEEGKLKLGILAYAEREIEEFKGYKCPVCSQVICKGDLEAIDFLKGER